MAKLHLSIKCATMLCMHVVCSHHFMHGRLRFIILPVLDAKQATESTQYRVK